MRRYPAVLATVQTQLDAQEKAGVRLPREAAGRVRTVLLGQVQKPEQSFAWPDDMRLAPLSAPARMRLRDALREAIAHSVNPALEALAARFGPQYQANAPTRFGLAQYPGGKAYYRALIRRELTLEDSPEELFKASQHALDMIESELKALRGEMGWSGSRRAFEDRLRQDTRFTAKTTAEVEATYLDYLHRMDPFMPILFCRPPPYGYGVARASPAQEAALTFGYADIQIHPERRGMYYYNGSQLDQRSLLPAQGLIYHELAPGHYWHDAMRFLSKSMTDYPRRNMAFDESWGDFGQQLAYEQGVFRTPQEKYGRLLFKAMFHARALADIGVNYHGKSFDWGLAVLRRYTFESDLQNRASLIRDTTDWQAQILPYSFGSQTILRLRERVRGELDDRFSEPRFYDAILMTGGAPFPVLDRHLDWFIEQERKGGAPGICV
ncbi:DUF885 domain-containing protein [Rhizorhabdus wittichii]|uniref:DUF885 domain-containing protein n=1 Tax=Rhizorhabdus wittichii TaxID=160791 RepID=A0A975CYT6_9SPHN|nr:DUF885 domain-containing protein [Rhizorhabdus wittichii]QTH20225.1 DUF885 domain-containing protein [Rhizorhabdus wittichii]